MICPELMFKLSR